VRRQVTEADLRHGETHAEDGSGPRHRADRNARYALLVFAAVLTAALPLILVLGRYLWFPYDDWDFLAGRTAGDIGDLFRPHNEHWSTLPILFYRFVWSLVGLRSYLPYQVPNVLLHLTVAVLLRMVMRRAGVGPWISTAAASLFALFGAGRDDIIWAFQIGFVAALAFGLVHLLLADHEGPVDWRDWLGLLAGSAGLLCSGVAVTMAVVVGLAMLVRRGWRIAALHTAPLGVLYLVWWLAVGRDAYEGAGTTIGRLAVYVRTGIGATFDGMGQLPGAGVALGVLLVVGLVVAWGPLDSAERRKRAAAPGALLTGAVLFLVTAGLGRANPPTGAAAFFPAPAAPSRYLYVVAALMLPAIAVAANAVVRRWRMFAPAVFVLLVIGIPGNLQDLADRPPLFTSGRGYKRLLLSLPRLPVAREVPGWVGLPGVAFLPRAITIGWLLDGAASGRVPDPGAIDPTDAATNTLRLALYQSRVATKKPCRNLTDTAPSRLDKGQSISIDSPVQVVYTPEGGAASRPISFNPANGRRLVALAGPLTLRVWSNNPAQPVAMCG
jgi:hypothetical protein